MGVIPSIVRKTSPATSLDMLSSTQSQLQTQSGRAFLPWFRCKDHICNARKLYSTFESHTQTFTVPGGTTTTEGIGTINLQVHNFQTGNVDTMTPKTVADMPMSKQLISTGELNKMNLHVNTEKQVVYSTSQQRGYHIQSNTICLCYLAQSKLLNFT